MSEQPLPPVHCELVGLDGNAYVLMGHWAHAARKAKWPKAEIDRVLDDARSGDYNHLLATLSANCADPPDEDDDWADDDDDCGGEG